MSRASWRSRGVASGILPLHDVEEELDDDSAVVGLLAYDFGYGRWLLLCFFVHAFNNRRRELVCQGDGCARKCSELVGRIPSYLLLTPLASFTLTRRFAATSPIKGRGGDGHTNTLTRRFAATSPIKGRGGDGHTNTLTRRFAATSPIKGRGGDGHTNILTRRFAATSPIEGRGGGGHTKSEQLHEHDLSLRARGPGAEVRP